MVHAAPNKTGCSEPLVRLEGLSVDFGRQQVLRDIDLLIVRGETLAVIGESGCGKTVFLKTIIALLRPSAVPRSFSTARTLPALGETRT